MSPTGAIADAAGCLATEGSGAGPAWLRRRMAQAAARKDALRAPQHDDHWPPEVDILETPKGDGLFTNHWQGPNGNGDNQQEAYQFPLDYTQWHKYGLEWTPTQLTMLVDDQVIKTTTTHIPAEAMSIGLMGYVGSPSQTWYGGSPAANVTHVGIDVDYVRVYDYIG